MGGSSSKSSSKPKDMTPAAFKELQGPFADVLNNMIGQYVPNGTKAIMGGYQGQLTTPISQGEQNALGNLNNLANANAQPTQLGPAPVASQPSQGTNNAINDFLGGTMGSGANAGAANQFVQGLNLQGANPTAGTGNLGDFQSQLAGASQTGAFGGANSNPFLEQYIQAAQRPTQQALEETLSRTLPGRFTQAGHTIQPGGSSAFDRAAAIATRGTADALGDIGTNISYQALEAARGREASSLENELARRGQQGLNTQNLTAQAQQNQLDRAMQVPGQISDLATAEQNRNNLAAQQGLTNAQTQQTGQQIQSQQIDSAIQNLQAQALPRLIQDLGVERGMEAFNNQVNALLSTLGIASGVTRPVISNESSSRSAGFQLK